MKEKQLYTAPAADLLVVRFEENLMASTNEAYQNNTDWADIDDWS